MNTAAGVHTPAAVLARVGRGGNAEGTVLPLRGCVEEIAPPPSPSRHRKTCASLATGSSVEKQLISLEAMKRYPIEIDPLTAYSQ